MTLATTLNIILAAFVLVAVVAPLAWAIHRSAAEEQARAPRARMRTRTRSEAPAVPGRLIAEA